VFANVNSSTCLLMLCDLSVINGHSVRNRSNVEHYGEEHYTHVQMGCFDSIFPNLH